MNWLKKRLERLEMAHSVRIGKDSFVYRMAEKEDKNFSGGGGEAVSLMMNRLKKDYEAEAPLSID